MNIRETPAKMNIEKLLNILHKDVEFLRKECTLTLISRIDNLEKQFKEIYEHLNKSDLKNEEEFADEAICGFLDKKTIYNMDTVYNNITAIKTGTGPYRILVTSSSKETDCDCFITHGDKKFTLPTWDPFFYHIVEFPYEDNYGKFNKEKWINPYTKDWKIEYLFPHLKDAVIHVGGNKDHVYPLKSVNYKIIVAKDNNFDYECL